MSCQSTKLLRAILSLSLIFLLSYCKHATEPPPPGAPDTTSHDFVWQVYLFGEGAPSHLRDVAIINDTLIYAVGRIYFNDSSGMVDPAPYNLALWNRGNWDILRIPYSYEGQLFYRGLQTVFAFSDTDVWIAGNGVQRWNGASFDEIELSAEWGPNLVRKIWGKNSTDLYAIGDNGSVANYNGSSWQSLSNPTPVDLQDICGTADGKNIWICGRYPDNSRSVLLRYDNGSLRTLWQRDGNNSVSPFGYNVTSVWRGTSTFITTSNGVFRLDSDSTQTKISDYFGNFAYKIRGCADNDIVVVGDGGTIWHYNGDNWKKVYHGNPDLTFYSCARKGNVLIAVGTDHSQFLSPAVICVGRRY